MGFRCLFHIHSRHSFDSLLSPNTILAKTRDLQADVLIVTDHESLRGSEDVARIANGNPLYVVRAGEYKTEKGDVIGLFLREEITSRNSNEVFQEIKRQGGLAVLPHPYKAHKLDDQLLSQTDLIESYNARCSEAENTSAIELAQRLGKPMLGGCDAHCAAEIGAVTNNFAGKAPTSEAELRDMLLKSSREIVSKKVSRVYQPYSQIIKACKSRNPRLFAYQVKQLASVLAREVFSH